MTVELKDQESMSEPRASYSKCIKGRRLIQKKANLVVSYFKPKIYFKQKIQSEWYSFFDYLFFK